MINLRYHIVSITAVFLALGIGLVFGAAFIDRATIDALESNLDAIEGQNDDLEQANNRLEDRLQAVEDEERALLEQGLAQLVDGRLRGVPVVVLTVEGVDAEAVTAASDAVVAAGADLGGVLRFSERLVLDDESEVTELADILQLGIDDPVRLRASLARRMGTVLAEASAPIPPPDPLDPGSAATSTTVSPDDPTTTTVPEPEPGIVAEPPLLTELRTAGFLELDAPPEPPAGFAVLPAAGLRVVVVSGPGAIVPDAELVAPLLARLTEDVVPAVPGPVVVAAQRGPDPDAEPTEEFDPAAERVLFVGPLREADPLRDRLSTIDDLERFSGGLALVLALEHGAAGQFGHYGVGAGAQSLLPPEPVAAG